jgi:hypothetical protein
VGYIFHLPLGPRTFRWKNRIIHFILDDFIVIHNKIMPPDSVGVGRAVLEVSGGSCLEECILEMAASRCRPRGPAPPEDGEELYDEPCTPTNIESPDDE